MIRGSPLSLSREIKLFIENMGYSRDEPTFLSVSPLDSEGIDAAIERRRELGAKATIFRAKLSDIVRKWIIY